MPRRGWAASRLPVYPAGARGKAAHELPPAEAQLRRPEAAPAREEEDAECRAALGELAGSGAGFSVQGVGQAQLKSRTHLRQLQDLQARRRRHQVAAGSHVRLELQQQRVQQQQRLQRLQRLQQQQQQQQQLRIALRDSLPGLRPSASLNQQEEAARPVLLASRRPSSAQPVTVPSAHETHGRVQSAGGGRRVGGGSYHVECEHVATWADHEDWVHPSEPAARVAQALPHGLADSDGQECGTRLRVRVRARGTGGGGGGGVCSRGTHGSGSWEVKQAEEQEREAGKAEEDAARSPLGAWDA